MTRAGTWKCLSENETTIWESSSKKQKGLCQWLIPAVLATQKAEIRRFTV
jgi:hypothetical protein